MKKLVSILLSIVLTATLCAPALAAGLGNFQSANTYTEGQFTDVPAGSTWAANVRTAYVYGIMAGKSDTVFDPTGNVTINQAIIMACRIHNTYHGNDAVFEGSRSYIDYAQKHSLFFLGNGMGEQQLGNPISRAMFATILSTALPDEALPEINSIEDGAIPDVEPASIFTDPYSISYDAIYRLYRAGVLTGSDEKGTFGPFSNITRGAAAAIVSRMADKSLRKAITLEKPPFEAVPIDQLGNLKSLRKSTTDAEFAQAYAVALEIVTPFAEQSLEDQLYGIAVELRRLAESGMVYSTSEPHYNDPYGYFVLGVASCAGCTRATGLCLSILGIPYEHVNENQWGHQWCRVNVDGTYWICDAYGLYCGPEPAPYEHPYL